MELNTKINSKVVASSLGWKLLERFFSQGVNLIVQIILARILLPEDFGGLAIIVAITNFAAMFVQSGLATVIIQKPDIEPKDINTLLSSSLFVALLLVLILFGTSPLIANIYSAPELVWPLRVLSLILFLNAFNSIQTAVLSRRMEFKTLFIRSVLAVPISGIVGIVMAYAGYGLWALVAHNLVNMLVVVIVMSIGTDFKFKLQFSWERAKKLYAFSIKILFTSIICGIGDTIRTMVIGKRYSKSDLAYYDKAYTYSNYVSLIFTSTISSVLLPTFARQQDNISTVKNMARRSVALTAFCMCPMLLGVVGVAEPLVHLLLTDKWMECVPFLQLFCILRLCGCISSIDKQVYYALGNSNICLCYEIGLLLANITSLVITIPYGILAIALGATIVELLGTLTLFIISNGFYGYTLRERAIDIFKPLINSVIMMGAILSVKNIGLSILFTILCQIIVGIITYVLLAIITRDSHLKEIKHILFSKFK